MGLTAEVWKRLKSLKVVPVPAEPDKNSKHIGSVLTEKVNFKRHSLWSKIAGTKGKTIPTQHTRVVMSRAARMGISVKEYEVKYPSNWKTARAYDEYLKSQLEAIEAQFPKAQTTDEVPF